MSENESTSSTFPQGGALKSVGQGRQVCGVSLAPERWELRDGMVREGAVAPKHPRVHPIRANRSQQLDD